MKGSGDMCRKEKNILLSLIICVLSVGLINIAYSMYEVYAQDSGSVNANGLANMPSEYHVNQNGQTYGIEYDSGESPDLIAAVGENGIEGYIKSEDLLDEGDFVQTPEKAIEYSKKVATLKEEGAYRKIPLYKSDGETIIGKFRVDY